MARKRGAPTLIELMRGRAVMPPATSIAASPKPSEPTLFHQQQAKANAAAYTPTMKIAPQEPGLTMLTPSTTQGHAIPAPAIEPKLSAAPAPTAAPVSMPAVPPRVPGTPRTLGMMPLWLHWVKTNAFWLTGTMVLVVVAWIFGAAIGKHNERLTWDKRTLTDAQTNKSDGAVIDPLVNGQNGGTGINSGAHGGAIGGAGATDQQPPVGEPAPPGPVVTPPPLQPGLNYLLVQTVTDRREDAEKMATYLTAHGVPTLVHRAGGSNQYEVVVSGTGYAKDQFTATKAERLALENKVRQLGRQWRAEDRKAPTDFSGGYLWKKFG